MGTGKRARRGTLAWLVGAGLLPVLTFPATAQEPDEPEVEATTPEASVEQPGPVGPPATDERPLLGAVQQPIPPVSLPTASTLAADQVSAVVSEGSTVQLVESKAAKLGVAFVVSSHRPEAVGVPVSEPPAEVRLQIPGLDRAFSASMAERLVIARLSGCTDDGVCKRAETMPTAVDVAQGTVSARVTRSLTYDTRGRDEAVFVLASAPSGPSGDFTASQAPSLSSWSVGTHTGAVQASYDIAVPPSALGSAPDVTLTYDSGSVDGRASSKNNQPSWAGLGWEFNPGSITRVTETCADGSGTCWLDDDRDAGFALSGDQVSGRLMKVANQPGAPSVIEYRLETDANVVAFKHEDVGRPTGRIVGIDGLPDAGPGLWVLTHDGRVQDYGDASLCAGPEGWTFPTGPDYVDLEATAAGTGYWAVSSSGQVDSRCAALSADVSPAPTTPVVAMAGARSGEGYVLVTQAGVVYYFGTAANWGQPVSGLGVGDEVVDVEYSTSGSTLWVLTKHGRVFQATASGIGEVPGWVYDHSLHADAESLVGDDAGFSVVSASGGVFPFNMAFMGSAVGHIGAGAVDAVPARNQLGFTGMWIASEKRVAPVGSAWAAWSDGAWSITNPDAWGTWWEVITGDGVRHSYGRGFDPYWFTATYSVRTVPFEQPDLYCSPRCDGAYQWDLESSVDLRGRVTSWRWSQEVNWVPVGSGPRWSYIRAAHPTVVEYGAQTFDGRSVSPAKVIFLTLNRCAEAVSPRQNTCGSWPDTPIDLLCQRVGACSLTENQPVFFSQLKLWRAETVIAQNFFSAQAVNYFDFTYDWPDPNIGSPDPDSSEPKMVLSSAKRRRLDIPETPENAPKHMPIASWGYVMLPNRVHHPDGVSPMRMPRINGLVTELGGRVTFHLGQTRELDSAGCSMSDFEQTGFIRIPCDLFPSFDGSACDQPGVPCLPGQIGWVLWHKYKVTSTVVEDDTDNTLPAADQSSYLTTYDYGAPAWAYSQRPGGVDLGLGLCDAGDATVGRCNHWNDFRGHEYVAIHHPDGTGTEVVTFTGRNGERLDGTNSGETYPAPAVTDLDEGTHVNDRFKAGMMLERNTRAQGGALVDNTRIDYERQVFPGIGGTVYWLSSPDYQRSRLYGNDGCREPDVVVDNQSYDVHGNLLVVDRFTETPGGLAAPACPGRPATVALRTTRSYAINNAANVYLIHLPQFEAVTIRDTGVRQAATRWIYDSSTGAPVRGELTETRTQHDATVTNELQWTTTRAHYDTKGRIDEWTDASNNATTYTYDAVTGAVETITNAALHVQHFEVDQRFGGTTLVDDPATGATSAVYDGFGRLEETNDAEGPASGFAPLTRYEYALDETRTITPSMSAMTFRTYALEVFHKQWTISDGWGRVIQAQDNDPNNVGRQRLVSSSFDAFGRPFRQSRPYSMPGAPGNGLVRVPVDNWGQTLSYTETAYNVRGEVASVTELGAGETTVTLTQRDGLTVTVSDAQLRTTVREHDPLSRLVSVTEPSPGGIATYAYDPMDRMTTIVDPGGNQTVAGYRMDGARTSLNDPDMGLFISEFDAAARLVTSTDAAGQTLWHHYDELNRVDELRDSGPTGLRLSSWLYDTERPGLLSESVAYPDGGGTGVTVHYNYDDRGRTTAKAWISDVVPGGQVEMLWTYGRDGTVATTTYPTGETLTHGYNVLGQQTSMAGWASYVSGAHYNLDGLLFLRRTSVDGQGGFAEALTYDPLRRWLDRSQAFVDTAGTAVAVDNQIERDKVGNITERAEVNTGQRECFGYDNLNRLTTAYTTGAACTAGHQPGIGPDPYSAAWAYQPDGNMTQALGPGTLNGSYTYADANHPHAVTQAGGATLTYNPFGAVATRTVPSQAAQTFAYDQRQRLTSVTQGPTSTAFVYDADGGRLARTHNGTTTVSYDDWMEDTVDAGGVHTTRTPHYKANGQMIANRVIPLTPGSPPADQAPVNWYTHDHLGTITASRTGNSAPIRQRTYPYGTDRTTNPAPQTDHNYIDKIKDPTGLYHLGARYYDPLVGRFLAADPLARPSNAQSVNPYTYALGNPIMLTDPSGLWPIGPACARSSVTVCEGGPDTAGATAGAESIETIISQIESHSAANDIGQEWHDDFSTTMPASISSQLLRARLGEDVGV